MKAKIKVTCPAVSIMFSVLIGIAAVMSKLAYPAAKNNQLLLEYRITWLNWENIILFIVVFLVSMTAWPILYRGLKRIQIADQISSDKNEEKKIFLSTVLVVLICWLPCWLTFFPGAGMNDTINMLNEPLQCIDLQPLWYTLLLHGIMHWGENVFGSMYWGFALYVGLQIVLFALVLAYNAVWLRRHRIKKMVIALYIAYFAILPIHADYALTAVRDSLYAYLTLLLLMCMVDILQSKGKWIVDDPKHDWMFSGTILILAFTRSNGKIIAGIVLICFIFFYKDIRKYFIKTMIILIVIHMATNVISDQMYDIDVGFREAVSVPLAQMSAVVAYEGNISPANAVTLENMLPLSEWEKSYCFSNADPLKFHTELNNQWIADHKPEFVKLWLDLGMDNPGIYLKSYTYHSYGFWNLFVSNRWIHWGGQSLFRYTCNNTENTWWNAYVVEHGFENSSLLPAKLADVLKNIYEWGFTFLGSGQLFWIIALLGSYALYDKKKKVIIVYGIIGLNWLTLMVAAPISYGYRYSYYMLVCLPVLLLLILKDWFFEAQNEKS